MDSSEIETIVNEAPEAVKTKFKYRTFDAGDILVFPKGKNDLIYILTDGIAEVYRENELGRLMSITQLHSYSIFGEVEVFGQYLNTAGIIAKTSCSVITLNKVVVRYWLEQDSRLSIALIKQLCDKLLSNTSSLEKLMLLNIEDRILCSIYSHFKIGDLKSLTKEELCIEVCAPRRSINRSLNICIEAGYINYQNKEFIVIDEFLLFKHVEPLLYH